MRLTYPSSLKLASLELVDGRFAADARWRITDHSAVIGHGDADFRAASRRLFTWQAHAYAHVAVTRDVDVVTLKFGPTTSPCLVLHEEQSANRAVLVYGTLDGHVECGEEAFVVEKRSDGAVIGRCVAFSRHAWWLARLGAPVARAVQLWVTRRYVEGMKP